MFNKKIQLFICYKLLSLVNGETCIVFAKDNPDLPPTKYNPDLRKTTCDYLYEECCTTGCCPKSGPERYFWIILVALLCLLMYSIYACRKQCCQRRRNAVEDVRTIDRTSNTQELQLPVGTSTEIIIPSSSPPQEDNTQRVTPPPSYDDVMTGKLK